MFLVGPSITTHKRNKSIIPHLAGSAELCTRYHIREETLKPINLFARGFELVTQLLALFPKHLSLHVCMYEPKLKTCFVELITQLLALCVCMSLNCKHALLCSSRSVCTFGYFCTQRMWNLPQGPWHLLLLLQSWPQPWNSEDQLCVHCNTSLERAHFVWSNKQNCMQHTCMHA